MTKNTEEAGPFKVIESNQLKSWSVEGPDYVRFGIDNIHRAEQLADAMNWAWQAGRSSVTAQVELSESQWAVLSNRMIEEHRKYGNHLRGGHWAEIAARKVVSHMRDFGCLAAPSTVPLSPEMVERIVQVVLKWVYKSGEIDYNLITSLLPEEKECGETKYVADLRTRLLGIR